MPAVTQDDQRRIPLHWACCTSFDKPKKKGVKAFFGPNQKELVKWQKRQLIDALLNEYPEGALCKDIHGKTPLDYAKENTKIFQLVTIKRLEREMAFWSDPVIKKSEASLGGSGSPETATLAAAEAVLPEDIVFDEDVYAKFCDDEASIGYADIIDAIVGEEVDES